MDKNELKEQEKKISEIFVGTWEFIITNPDGKKKWYKVIIDESRKYYINDEFAYDFKAEFVGKNILIHKNEISNRFNQSIERLDYLSDGILSGIDDKNNSIEYIKRYL